MNKNDHPSSFYDKQFLLSHSEDILNFYSSCAMDISGGFFHNYYDNGETFNKEFKQLVSSCRMVVNFARAYSLFGDEKFLRLAKHGLEFVETVHWQKSSKKYAWTLVGNAPLDMTQQNYGYAFVMLMYAAIQKSGISEVETKIRSTFDLMEERFWLSGYGLYADELSVLDELSDYRGQNANMHSCEAMISAYEATRDQTYLERAQLIAENITVRQAAQTNGFVWEHYTPEFEIDWDYNKDDPKNLYRPWGFQPGHQTEWSKLLVALHRISPNQKHLETAKSLFNKTFEISWDKKAGGLIYGFDPKGNWCDDDKYFWVQAESFAAAAMLYQETRDQCYLNAYEKLWAYSWEHFVDHEYGAWFRLLDRNNKKYSNEKSSAGAKCDYHTLGACFDSLAEL